MRDISFQKKAFSDMVWWAQEQPKIVSKILVLIQAAAKTPFSGLGKPELLKGNFKGYWSRRITDEHRLVYKVLDDEVIIFSVKGHY